MTAGGVDAHFSALALSGAWAALYEGPETAANTSFRVRLARTLELLPPEARRVLDVGCGPAPLARPLEQREARYVGTDLVTAMLREARSRHPRAQLARADARLPFRDGIFDAVVALGFVEYLEDSFASLVEIRRVVRRGGTVVVSVPKRHHIDVVALACTAPLRALAALVRGRRTERIPRLRLDARELDALAVRAGLRPDGGEHYHFTPLPYPFTVLTPKLSLRAGRALEDSATRRRFSFLAHGYLGRYRRD
jgi:SAM-dependent methyltransferase